MEAFKQQFAGQLLLQLAASGAIKLVGPAKLSSLNEEQAKTDAAYLLALYKALTESKPG